VEACNVNIETARAIIAASRLAPSQADWMLAGRVLYDHWQRNPHLLKPVRSLDAAPIFTRDARSIETPLATGTTADPQSGPERILKLPGPATSYSIMSDSHGDVRLVQHAEIDGYGDNGKVGIPAATGDTALARRTRAQAQRDAGAAFAERFNQRERQRWGQS
jgi:hypothetical protein